MFGNHADDMEIILSLLMGGGAAIVLDWLLIDGQLGRYQFLVLMLLFANLLVNSLKEGYYAREYRREMLKQEAFGKLGKNANENADEDAEKIADVEV